MHSDHSGEFDEFTIGDFARLMHEGALSSSDLVEYYTDRISRIDAGGGAGAGSSARVPQSQGPRLNSILHMNDEAFAIAGRLDEERRRGAVRGPFHGIPILLKGNIDSGDSMPTTAGSLALQGRLAAEDAPLVARLREAGAVILGKTNLSEWANFRSTHSSSGWSSEGGQTRNPYALDRNPSGSSSGSAVAVSANLCAAAVGTETDGSIISPSSVNGIVGIKPTVGAVSAQGIVPLSFSQDTAGPMARTMRDAALLLAAMAEPGTMSGMLPPAGMELRDLRGIRLGIARNFCGVLPDVDTVFEEALRALRDLGAETVEMKLEAEAGFDEAELEVMLYEFRHGIAEYLARGCRNAGTDAMRDLGDLIAFNRSRAGDVMPWFGQELFEMAATKGGLDDEAYLKARALCASASRERGIDAALARDRLDAILSPSGSPAWKTDHILGDHYMGGGCTSLPAAAGYPHLTLPSGFIHGLPVGLSIFGPKYGEATLVRIASAFESVTKVRRPPRFEAAAG